MDTWRLLGIPDELMHDFSLGQSVSGLARQQRRLGCELIACGFSLGTWEGLPCCTPPQPGPRTVTVMRLPRLLVSP